MWHCDELLTIVVIALVNRFVHGHVPTPVNWQKNIKCKLTFFVQYIWKYGRTGVIKN